MTIWGGTPGPDQVPDSASPQIVNDAAGDPGGRARLPPELAEVADSLAGDVEDVRAVEATQLQPPLDDRCELTGQRQYAPVPVLAVLRAQADHAFCTIVVAPLKVPDLADAPRAEEQAADDVCEVRWEILSEGLELLGRESLSDPTHVAHELRDLRLSPQSPPADREGEGLAEQREFDVGRARSCPRGGPPPPPRRPSVRHGRGGGGGLPITIRSRSLTNEEPLRNRTEHAFRSPCEPDAVWAFRAPVARRCGIRGGTRDHHGYLSREPDSVCGIVDAVAMTFVCAFREHARGSLDMLIG